MDLKALRENITNIDSQIVELISKRSEIAIQIAQLKKKDNEPIYQPTREQEVFSYLSSINKGPLQNQYLHNIYREIMSGAKALQNSFSIAYLGPAGSFTHEASLNKFGHSLSFISQKDITSVFRSVESGECMYGIVPFENSIEGKVLETLDTLANADVQIYAESKLSIHHNLLTYHNIDDIKKIYTHRQAKAQCRNWLAKYLPEAEWIETPSTSNAVEFISKNINNKEIAAIGSIIAGNTYNVPILKKNIEDCQNNYTRFITLSKTTSNPSELDHTSILFTLPHTPGSLCNILEYFHKSQINITSIESRPDPQKIWNYLFYLDIEGHCKNEKINKILDIIQKETTFYKLLGSYPIESLTR